jgi:hypothetical protein
MAGRFLRRGAIVDTIKSEHHTNAIRNRSGFARHRVRVTVCGCPDPNCGAFHVVETGRTIPTAEEANTLLAEDKKARKARSPRRRRGSAEPALERLRPTASQRFLVSSRRCSAEWAVEFWR